MAFYSKYTTNNTLIFDQLIRAYVLVEETLSPVLPVCLVKQLKCLCNIFTKFAAKFHTRTLFFKLFHSHCVANLMNNLHVISSADVARRLMLIAKWDK